MYEKDAEHLKLLSTLHFVLAGIMGFFACLPLLHVAMGIMMLRSPEFMSGGDPAGAPPPFMGWIFVAMGSLFFLAGWAMVAALIFAGKYLRRRTHHTFCLVVAGISCMFMPLGTALGVFSLVMLTRPHVKAWFDAPPLPVGSPFPADAVPSHDWR